MLAERCLIVVYIFRWSSLYCSKAKLIMKIDDDALLRAVKLEGLAALINRLSKAEHPVYAGEFDCFKRYGVCVCVKNMLKILFSLVCYGMKYGRGSDNTDPLSCRRRVAQLQTGWYTIFPIPPMSGWYCATQTSITNKKSWLWIIHTSLLLCLTLLRRMSWQDLLGDKDCSPLPLPQQSLWRQVNCFAVLLLLFCHSQETLYLLLSLDGW